MRGGVGVGFDILGVQPQKTKTTSTPKEKKCVHKQHKKNPRKEKTGLKKQEYDSGRSIRN